MVSTPWRHLPLTKEQEHELFMLLLRDDTEDAPWMPDEQGRLWSEAMGLYLVVQGRMM